MITSIFGLLIMLTVATKAAYADVFKSNLSVWSGSKLHYRSQSKILLSINGSVKSDNISDYDIIHVENCNADSCVYSVTTDGSQLRVHITISSDGTLLDISSLNESDYRIGKAMGVIARTMMFQGIEFELGKIKACGMKAIPSMNALLTLTIPLANTKCELIRIENNNEAQYAIIRFENTIKKAVGNIDANWSGEVTVEKSTGIIVKERYRLVGLNLPLPSDELSASGEIELYRQKSRIVQPPPNEKR